MLVTYKQCDLCKSRIENFSDELHIKYKAKRQTLRCFPVEDAKDKIPFTTNWVEIDICEDCIREIIKRRYEKDKE